MNGWEPRRTGDRWCHENDYRWYQDAVHLYQRLGGSGRDLEASAGGAPGSINQELCSGLDASPDLGTECNVGRPIVAHPHAAIEDDIVPGDKSRQVTGQKERGVGDIVRNSRPWDGLDRGEELSKSVFGLCRIRFCDASIFRKTSGYYRAWTNAVDTDEVWPKFIRDPSRRMDQRGFCRRVSQRGARQDWLY